MTELIIWLNVGFFLLSITCGFLSQKDPLSSNLYTVLMVLFFILCGLGLGALIMVNALQTSF